MTAGLLLDVFAFLAALAAGFFALKAAGRARQGCRRRPRPPIAGGGTRTGIWRVLGSPLSAPAVHNQPISMPDHRLQTGVAGPDEVDRFYAEKVLAIFRGLGFGMFFAAAVPVGIVALLIRRVLMGVLAPTSWSRQIAERQPSSARRCRARSISRDRLEPPLSSRNRQPCRRCFKHPAMLARLSLTRQRFRGRRNLPDALRRLARRVGLARAPAMCAVIAQRRPAPPRPDPP